MTGATREGLRAFAAELDLPGGEIRYVEESTVPAFRIGEGHLLKFLDPAAPADEILEVQLAWCAHLADQGVDVPAPVPLADGAWFGRVPESRGIGRFRYVLLPWLEGERCNDAREFTRSDPLFRMGRVVARMHAASRTFPSKLPDTMTVHDVEAIAGPGCCLHLPEMAEHVEPPTLERVRSFADELVRVVGELGRADDRFGLIHADLGPQNWIFHAGQPRPIDFAETSLGYLAYDLLMIVWSHAGWDDHLDMRRSVVRGYESVQALPEDVAARLDAFSALTVIHWMNWVMTLDGGEEKDACLANFDGSARTIHGEVRSSRSKLSLTVGRASTWP